MAWPHSLDSGPTPCFRDTAATLGSALLALAGIAIAIVTAAYRTRGCRVNPASIYEDDADASRPLLATASIPATVPEVHEPVVGPRTNIQDPSPMHLVGKVYIWAHLRNATPELRPISCPTLLLTSIAPHGSRRYRRACLDDRVGLWGATSCHLFSSFFLASKKENLWLGFAHHSARPVVVAC